MAIGVLEDRAIGKYPISIPTSLALEALNGIHDDYQPIHPPVRNYRAIWINVRTLFRNMHGSLNAAEREYIDPRDYGDELSEEMQRVTQAATEESPIQIHWYLSDYRGLSIAYPNASVRGDTTEKQKHYTDLQNRSLAHLLTLQGDVILKSTLEIDNPHPKSTSLLLTHYAFDLLSQPALGDVSLLESHTGKIKTRGEWYTKFHDGKALSQIPFNTMMLQVFGDAETFAPQPIKLRKEVLALAAQYGWSQITTVERIRANIRTMQNQWAREILLQF